MLAWLGESLDDEQTSKVGGTTACPRSTALLLCIWSF
jgi:hypothetical protein